MPQGGTLSVETQRVTGQGSRDPQIVVTITDTGIGIPPESLKTLFQPFHTTKVKGTGLGLSISKNIIESHKGRIKVESELGKGTAFIIKLTG